MFFNAVRREQMTNNSVVPVPDPINLSVLFCLNTLLNSSLEVLVSKPIIISEKSVVIIVSLPAISNALYKFNNPQTHFENSRISSPLIVFMSRFFILCIYCNAIDKPSLSVNSIKIMKYNDPFFSCKVYFFNLSITVTWSFGLILFLKNNNDKPRFS